MANYIYPGIVSCLALLVYYFKLLRSGLAPGEFKVSALAHSGYRGAWPPRHGDSRA